MIEVYDPATDSFREAQPLDIIAAQGKAAAYDALVNGLQEILRQRMSNGGTKVKQISDLLAEVDKLRREYNLAAFNASKARDLPAIQGSA